VYWDTVCRIENGTENPSVQLLLKLATALCVNVELRGNTSIVTKGSWPRTSSKDAKAGSVVLLKKSFRKDLGHNVRLIRYTAGLSQKQLAEVAGMKVSTLSGIENGTEKLCLETIFRLVKAAGASIEDLVRGL
jgi:transcriptional regulator with XRE-family HTH domain